MRNESLGQAMFDVNASMRTHHIHRTHPPHNTSDAIINHKCNQGGLPASTYSDLLVKHGIPLNAYVGTPDETLFVAMMYPMLGTTQTGVGGAKTQFETQTSFNSHPTLLTQGNGRRHAIGSLNSSSPSKVKQSQMLPYFLAPGRGYPCFSTLPATGSGTMGKNTMVATHQLQRVGPVKRSRSQPMADDQLWNNLEHAERLHKSLRVDRIKPPHPFVPSNKNHASRNRRDQPILKDGAITSETNDVRHRQANYVPAKGLYLGAQKESHSPKREQVNRSKFETHSMFISTQSSLAKPKVTLTTNGTPLKFSTSTSPPIHPLMNANTLQAAGNELRVSPPRKKGRRVPYTQGRLGYSPGNAAVRVGSYPTLSEKDERVIQYSYDLPKINTKYVPMNNTISQVHHIMHPYGVIQPHCDNGTILYNALAFPRGPGGQFQLNGGSYLQPSHQKDGFHRVDHKLVNPLQSRHDKVRQKLRYELQCKRGAIRPQRPNDVVTRHSASVPVTFHSPTSVKSIQTQSGSKSSNVLNSYFTSSEQDGVNTIPESTLNKGPQILQNGNMTSLKLPHTNSSSAASNTFTSQRVDPSKDFPMINKHESSKEATNTGGIPAVKNEQKQVRERVGNIKGRKVSGQDADVRQMKNTLSTTKYVVDPNEYVNPMTYGKFLKEIIVPMTLAVSNKGKKNEEKFASLLKLCQNEPNRFQSESRPDNESSLRKFTRNTNVAKTEELGRILLKEEACKVKVPSEGGSVHEEETKRMNKDVEDHENPSSVEERTTSKWDEQITSKTSDILANNTTNIVDKNDSLKEKHTTEDPDEVSSSILATPRMKSVRVVLRTSDRIRMKFYNVGSSQAEQPKEDETKRGKKRKGKRRKYMKKKKILMRIGSEKLFTRSLYCSSISPGKSAPQRRKKKAKENTTKLPPPPKDFNRIALSVHKYAGETILHRVVRVNAKEILLYCLENNVGDINAKDNAGYTPLHECCVFDKVWMAEKLILHGADVNASAHDGTRPIHDAVENHRAEMTRLLLSHGADPLLPTYAKRTALDNATSLEIKTLLHDYLRDMNGESEELFSKLKLSNLNRRTIRLRSSFSTQESEQWIDNFLDTSDLNESPEEQHDAILYLKEIPQPKHIRLQLKDNEAVKTWYLLSDVLARLKIPAATFPYLYPHVKVNGLPTSIFLKKIERVAGLNQFDFTAICGKRELVEFVEADDEMCSILQFEGWVL